MSIFSINLEMFIMYHPIGGCEIALIWGDLLKALLPPKQHSNSEQDK